MLIIYSAIYTYACCNTSVLLTYLQLVDDPIFIHINKLEQSSEGKPEVFGDVVANMTRGIKGHIYIQDASRAVPKVRSILRSTLHTCCWENEN